MMTLLVILLLLILFMIAPWVGIIVLIGMEFWYFPEVFIPLLVVGLIIAVFVWMFHTSGMSAKQEAEQNEKIRRESEEVCYQQYAENRREHPGVPLQDWGIIWGENDVEAYEVRFQREKAHPDRADHGFYELRPLLEAVGSLFAAHMSSADQEEVSFPTTMLDEAIARRHPRYRNLSRSIRRAFRERVSAAYKVAMDTSEPPPRYVEVCRASGEVDESEGGSHGTMR